MSLVRLEIGGRGYDLAVRDGQEAHFTRLAEAVDAQCREAVRAAGGLTEVRQLLFAALLLADEAAEAAAERDAARAAHRALDEEHGRLRDACEAMLAEAAAAPPEGRDDTHAAAALADAVERLADRLEAAADGLEKAAAAA